MICEQAQEKDLEKKKKKKTLGKYQYILGFRWKMGGEK